MLIYIDTPRRRHEDDLLQAFAGSLHRLGHATTPDHKAKAQAAIVWNGRDWPGTVPTLYCECGWLPRWHYQVSHRDINASSHLAPLAPAADYDREDTAAKVADALAGNPYAWPYLWRSQEPAPAELPERFILVPLQIEADTNMRHVAECRRTPTGLAAYCVGLNPSLPLVFKLHPAFRASLTLDTDLRPGDAVTGAFPWTVHDLLASGRVAEVWTANSNCLHDALAWGVPARAFDAGIWGDQWDGTREAGPYLAALMAAQWTRDRARDPAEVARALDLAVEQFTPPAVHVEPPARTVNVVVGNRGWLFNDLAAHLARCAPRAGCRVLRSERPDPAADAYLYMRADEARQCPHPERAVCQVHDQWGNWGGRFDGVKVAGWSMTHPGQAAMLARYVDLRGRRSLLLPLGAPEDWKPRDHYDPTRFHLAWVGRAVAFKRLSWFATACRSVHEAIPGFRAVLLGANLEPWRDLLAQAGVPVELRTKEDVGFDRYQGQYHGFDAVVICSDPDGDGEHSPRGEAHPMPLFEALACGVPVVSSYVGYAPFLAPYLYRREKGLREGILAAARNREADFARRHEYARRARQWGTLESWCVRNLQFCLEVANVAQ